MINLFDYLAAKNIAGIITAFFLLIVLSYYYLLFLKVRKPEITEMFSSITVIMPAHNEEKVIMQSLHAVLSADFKGRKEILVVDDGSIDKTAEIVSSFKKKGVILIRTSHCGKSSSINKALKIAKGDVIAIVDADSCIHKDSLKEIVKELSRDNIAGASGVVRVKNRKRLLGMWMHIEQVYYSLIRLIFSKLNANINTPGPLSAYRKKALVEIGGFSTKGYAEDVDITIRLIRKGYQIGYAEDAIVDTYMPTDLKGFFRQRLRFARGTIDILKRHMRANTSMIDVYTMPILLFSYVQAVIMGVFTLYQIFSGYFTYFIAKGVYINFPVFKFFFEWFSIVGFIRWVISIINGQTELTIITAIGILSTLLSYPLYLVAIYKFDKKFDIWHLIPIMFMFPFWIMIMVIYAISIPEYFKRNQYNIWKKNE
ncbi:glycosyltransferase family 2 protein [Candidatus Woesearchaeota archaeon]|nr:glycosyltransferase family 2 protein [Candidatus Woesearchaeota archaeon]